MITLLLALWLGINQPRTVDVDLLELNTTNVNGCKFEQVILWVWNPCDRRHEVSDWWMVDGEYPERLTNRRWQCIRKGLRIQTNIYRRTETRFDPERANTRLLPSELRVSRL